MMIRPMTTPAAAAISPVSVEGQRRDDFRARLRTGLDRGRELDEARRECRRLVLTDIVGRQISTLNGRIIGRRRVCL